jgi:hypothetical protein
LLKVSLEFFEKMEPYILNLEVAFRAELDGADEGM